MEKIIMSLIVFIPSLLFAKLVEAVFHTVYHRYHKINIQANINGYSFADKYLSDENIYSVDIIQSPIPKRDFYSPLKNNIFLSGENFSGTSIASIATAAHEVGHAVQFNKINKVFSCYSVVYPVFGLVSNLSYPLFFLGLITSSGFFQDIGIICLLGALVATLITLPIEIHASFIALTYLRKSSILTVKELKKARFFLFICACTYMIAVLYSLSALVRAMILRK